jgi:hypothetical protein
MSDPACTVCLTGRYKEGCDFEACRACCVMAQAAQGLGCVLPEHLVDIAESSVGGTTAKRGRREPVVFPEHVRKMDATSPFLIFCPHSLVHYHLRCGRGLELIDSRIDRTVISLERDGGRAAGGKKKSDFGRFDWRDVAECRVWQEVVSAELADDDIPTPLLVKLLTPKLKRLYELLVVKREGGVAMLKRFSAVGQQELLPTWLRAATLAARKDVVHDAREPKIRKVASPAAAGAAGVVHTRRRRRGNRGATAAYDDDEESSSDDDDDEDGETVPSAVPARRARGAPPAAAAARAGAVAAPAGTTAVAVPPTTGAAAAAGTSRTVAPTAAPNGGTTGGRGRSKTGKKAGAVSANG